MWGSCCIISFTPRRSKVFARLFQKAAGEKKGKAPRGSCLFSRAAPFPRAAALIIARPAGRKSLFRRRVFRQQEACQTPRGWRDLLQAFTVLGERRSVFPSVHSNAKTPRTAVRRPVWGVFNLISICLTLLAGNRAGPTLKPPTPLRARRRSILQE